MKYKGLVKLSNNILKILEEKKMTQGQLALRSGLTHVTISNYINCHREPRISNLGAIARALGVNVSDLLSGIEAEEMM